MRTSNEKSYQKQKSSFALRIRVIIFLGVVVIYAIFKPNVFVQNDAKPSKNFGRKLLSEIGRTANRDPEFILKSNLSTESNRSETMDQIIELIPLLEVMNGYVIASGYTNATPDEAAMEPKTNCTNSTVQEFPGDGLTRQQRRQGWIVIHVLLACYCFWLLAIICDDYFVPAIDLMCSSIAMEADVIGATIMAAAVSSPELFINCVGTFVTKSDLGIGTIVGSAVFNILAVPACCGLLTQQTDNLNWWPLTRDCIMYGFAIVLLIGTLYDGKVMWYEALVMVISYFAYVVGMFLINQTRCNRHHKDGAESNSWDSICISINESEESASLLEEKFLIPRYGSTTVSIDTDRPESKEENVDESFLSSPWTIDRANFTLFFLRWPITLLLWSTIPDCRKYPHWKYLTFAITVIWLAITSYLISLLITYVGDTLSIPDSIMGLTILAAGMSIPEAVSSILITNQGHGAMGISSSIGSNTFGILIGLGLPWFVKSNFFPSAAQQYWILLNSAGLTYSATALLLTLFGFYVSFFFNRFYLNIKVGISCIIMYAGFLVLAIMLELNFFAKNVTLPTCD